MHKNAPLLFLGGIIALAALAALLRSLHPARPQAPVLSLDSAPKAVVPSFPRPRPSVLTIYITGEVLHPGLLELPAGARVEAALRAAGGATGNADLIAVNLAEPLRDGEEVVLLSKGMPVPSPARRRRSRRTSASSRVRKAPSEPIDLNAADERQLAEVPGIGPGLAARIVAYRQLNGPFGALDDLRDVGGMTESKVDHASAYLRL